MTDTTDSTDSKVEGSTAPGFEPVAEEFGRLLARERDARGQFCGYLRGERVVDLWAGPDVAADDLQGVYSSTKGVAGICIALLVQRGVLDLDAPVSRYWPEFADGGKGDVTVRLALSHQAGIPGVEPQLTLEEVIDHDGVAARLAAQVPHWRPGTAHGYHGLTIGTIMDELVRRVVGVPVAEFFRKEIGDPRGIDFYIAAPEDVDHRVRMLLPVDPTQEQAAQADEPSPPDGLTGMTFNVARSASAEPLPNIRAFRASGQAAAAGVASARGLARLYAMCLDEVDGFPRLLTDDTIARVAQIQTAGIDLVLRVPNRFGVVFQKYDDRAGYGSHQAFGHDGAGGSLGVADPWHGISYAWTPRRMSFPGGGDTRGLGLAGILRDCAGRATPRG
ncbi:MAG TPA: serine hydrolase domain-containing protein [Trebonia sp.]|jgi:CubicO group peptidase (beta-lactamase class C family)